MQDFAKYSYEELYRYYQFRREDGLDGLADLETISSHTVTCVDVETGDDKTAEMIDGSSVVDGTMVEYLLKNGTAGKRYLVIIRAVTSNGQTFEGRKMIVIK